METWVGTRNLVFVAATQYVNDKAFHILTWQPPHQENSPYLPPGDALSSSVILSTDNFHQQPVNCKWYRYKQRNLPKCL